MATPMQEYKKLNKFASSNEYSSKTVLELFEENIEYYENTLAIDDGHREITYGALNRKANNLAEYLQKAGACSNTIIAIYLEPSLEFIISILAILKIGAAYLPLDTEAPFARNNIILQDCNPTKIITFSQLATRLLNYQDNVVVLNDSLLKETTSKHKSYFNDAPKDLIYVMYTSGSTGTPKGCMIPNRAVVNLAKNKNMDFVKQGERLAHISNIAFDASTFEIWSALLNRAAIFIYPRAQLICVDSFSAFLKEKKITILFLTTAFLNLIVRHNPDCFDNLKFLLFGGEKVNHEIINVLLNRKKIGNLNQLNIYHVYGPTENTTFSTKFLLEETNYKKNIPIGRPLENIEAYILDASYQEVPVNEIGEIFLAGENLALGYLGDIAHTKEKFIFDKTINKMIYKTGDFAYRDENNLIVFVGRKDSQIKIRGHRVELHEIETIFLEYELVDQVLIDTDVSQSETFLIAYVIPFVGKSINNRDFYSFLHQYLPDYMLPRKIYILDEFPLNLNGKIDKKKLRGMELKTLLDFDDIQLPTNKIELIIFNLFTGLLNQPNISIDHNFFDLGMNSLMVIEACTQLNLRIIAKKKIEEIDFFTHPTIRLLSKYISDNKENKEFAESSKRALLQRNVFLRKRHDRAGTLR